MRINKYIAYCGFCSRRKAELYIKKKLVKVNGKIIDYYTFIVSNNDNVSINNIKINLIQKKVYLVINKPKYSIVSNYDIYNRNTIYKFIPNNLIKKFRIYTIGRLDYNSTGVLLLTNDGMLTYKLLHPKNKIIKIYLVTLNMFLTYNDLIKIKQGLKFKEGFLIVNDIYYYHNIKNKIIIKLHIGWNRIIRRIFNSLYYNILSLERISFANITINGLKKGMWRFLYNHEINSIQKL